MYFFSYYIFSPCFLPDFLNSFFSSVLALFGMIIGVLLGNIENFSVWIFSATAGVFLYVALVDMIPELNSGHAHPISEDDDDNEDEENGGATTNSNKHTNGGSEDQFFELFLHLAGMCLGIGLMLLIALYEHDLKNFFVQDEHVHIHPRVEN